MTPRPNFAGYVVLAAFVAALAWVDTAKASTRKRVDVARDGTIASGLFVWWSPEFEGQLQPDYYEQNTNEWAWLHDKSTTFVTPKTEVEVMSE